MKKVTLWYKKIKNNEGIIIKEEFNHLADGWVEGKFPLPKDKSFSNQVAWENDEWRFAHREMDENYKVSLT